MMRYPSLSPSLHSTADAAAKYFRQQQGATRFRAEEPIDEDIAYRPTLSANTRDYHFLCVEVTDSRFVESLEAFINDCVHTCLPVRLYIALPKGLSDTTVNQIQRRARKLGVGVLEVDDSGGDIIQPAISLSLAGVRPVDPKQFPSKYRQALSVAEVTFRNGNPPKGCALIYDELEALSRRLAQRTFNYGLWANAPSPPDFQRAPWAKVIDKCMNGLDYNACKPRCRGLVKPLMARVFGVTTHRNESGHKPRNRKALIRRDRELRTRFENGRDLLLDLVNAIKPMRV